LIPTEKRKPHRVQRFQAWVNAIIARSIHILVPRACLWESTTYFQNLSQAIREAVSEKLLRMKRSRLAIECAKLDRVAEKAMVEESMTEDVRQWPEY
jgi:predicted LPLAT superfamily acyltransferase